MDVDVTKSWPPRLHIRELDAHRRRQLSSASMVLQLDQPILVGREGAVALGIDPSDTGVSRQALTVTATVAGWDVVISNGHGAWVCLWGQGHMRMEPDTSIRRVWPRIGVRVVGGERDLEHWVLLEYDGYRLPDPAHEIPDRPQDGTDLAHMPRPLTPPQQEAVQAVFTQYLAWPPITGPTPSPLAAAAARLHVTATAISDRLEKVQQRAYAFGLPQQRGVSDPEYIHLLARHGYFPLPSAIASPGAAPATQP